MSADKDVASCLHAIKNSNLLQQQLSSKNSGMTEYIYSVEANHPRAMKQRVLSNLIENVFNPDKMIIDSSEMNIYNDGNIERAITDAISTAKTSNRNHNTREVIVVCGTVFIMDEARAAVLQLGGKCANMDAIDRDDFVYYEAGLTSSYNVTAIADNSSNNNSSS